MVVFIPSFDLSAGPRSFAQKGQARLDTGIELEAADRDVPAHDFPAVPFHKVQKNRLERDAMQRIAGMGWCFRHDVFALLFDSRQANQHWYLAAW